MVELTRYCDCDQYEFPYKKTGKALWCKGCKQHFNPNQSTKTSTTVIEGKTTIKVDKKTGKKVKRFRKVTPPYSEGTPHGDIPDNCPPICSKCNYRQGRAGSYCKKFKKDIWSCRSEQCIYSPAADVEKEQRRWEAGIKAARILLGHTEDEVQAIFEGSE